MDAFLFRFGFCTPAQSKANDEHGWDDESSEAFFVRAESSKDAESWGCEVAERFCNELFERSEDWTGKIPSWKESGFAFWIESNTTSFPKEYLDRLPVINFGEFPEYGSWLKST